MVLNPCVRVPAGPLDIRVCSHTPRFSFGMLKTVICACPWCPARVASAVYSELRDGCTGTGWYTGWVYRVGIPGTTPPPGKRSLRQRSGPRKSLQGDWSGWSQVQRPPELQDPPFGPGRSGPASPPWSWTSPRLLANKGEIPPHKL